MRWLLAEAPRRPHRGGAAIAALPDAGAGTSGRGHARGSGTPSSSWPQSAAGPGRAPPARGPGRPPERRRRPRRASRRSSTCLPGRAVHDRRPRLARASTASTSPCGPDSSGPRRGRPGRAAARGRPTAGRGRRGRRGGGRRAPPPPTCRPLRLRLRPPVLVDGLGSEATAAPEPPAREGDEAATPPRRRTPGARERRDRLSELLADVEVLVRVLGEVDSRPPRRPRGQGDSWSPRGSGRWRRSPTWHCASPPSTARTSRSACSPTAPTRPRRSTTRSARLGRSLGDELFPPRGPAATSCRRRSSPTTGCSASWWRRPTRPRTPAAAADVLHRRPRPRAGRAVHRGGPRLRVGRAAPRHDRRPGGRRRRGARRGAPGARATGGRPSGPPARVSGRSRATSACIACSCARRGPPETSRACSGCSVSCATCSPIPTIGVEPEDTVHPETDRAARGADRLAARERRLA